MGTLTSFDMRDAAIMTVLRASIALGRGGLALRSFAEKQRLVPRRQSAITQREFWLFAPAARDDDASAAAWNAARVAELTPVASIALVLLASWMGRTTGA